MGTACSTAKLGEDSIGDVSILSEQTSVCTAPEKGTPLTVSDSTSSKPQLQSGQSIAITACEREAIVAEQTTDECVETQEPTLKLPSGKKLTVMMFGMTGAGKSSLGNLIAQSNVFHSGDDTASVTNLDSVMRYEAADESLILLDTIGLGDTEIDQDKVVASIRDVALSAINGVDVLIFVMRLERVTDDAITRLIYVVECLWGRECLMNLHVIVTHGGRYLRNRQEGDEWILRQVEINWRFKHIYSLVSNNTNRFIFIDNPDPESWEPNCKERRQMSFDAVMKMLVGYPRDILPPFTHSMMKKAQELADVERKDLEAKELEVQRLRDELKRLQDQTSQAAKTEAPAESNQADSKQQSPGQLASSESTAFEPSTGLGEATVHVGEHEKELQRRAKETDLQMAIQNQIASKQALNSKLQQIRHDEAFEEEALRQMDLSLIKFNEKVPGPAAAGFSGSDAAVVEAKSRAGRRMLNMLKKKAKKVINAITGTVAGNDGVGASKCSTKGCNRRPWNASLGQSCCHTCASSEGYEHGPECDKRFREDLGEVSCPEQSAEDEARMLDLIAARLRQSFHAHAPSDVYSLRWNDAEGLSPIRFQSFVTTEAAKSNSDGPPSKDLGPKTIAGLWRRADANCDGKIDVKEFCALFEQASA